jgi:hypothetical protein
MTTSFYQNFAVAIYTHVYEVNKMSELNNLKTTFELMQRQVKINKVYLETHRDTVIAEEAVIRGAKQYLESLGVKVSGGITLTRNERMRFQTYCYTTPEQRQKVKEISAYTASIFDEFILDDFFFNNCKCPACIAARGTLSWTDFRLQLMTEAARELILEPARAANPKVKVTVKYPNWYEHFQGLGFNLETQPSMFDFIYTGTETRDPVLGNQHLQPYESYEVFRYFENIKPGGNSGGWVDPFASFTLDRYAEQLWLTLFAKAPEITLFDFGSIQWSIRLEQRAAWQGNETSFDYDQTVANYRQPDGTLSPEAHLTLAAGAAFETVDQFMGKLGNPIGVPSYKPFHSTGEDFLHNYLGMLGIPIDLRPEFPTGASTILLTESAKFDPELVTKIKQQLMDGKTVIITSGLLKALQGKGFEEFVELHTSDRKATTKDFLIGWNRIYHAEQPITVPQIGYLTNDSWEEISCMVGVTGTPLFHSAQYGNSTLYILTIPDSFGDLYQLPAEVLTRIKETVTQDLFVRVEAPSQVVLFVYDNDTFIVESFRAEATDVRLVLNEGDSGLHDLVSGEQLTESETLLDWQNRPTGKKGFPLTLKPHSFRVFKVG